MKRLAGRLIDALALQAGIGRGIPARIERIAVHMLFMALVAERWELIFRGIQGIAREIKGI